MPVVLPIGDDRLRLALRKLLLETKGCVVLTATNGRAGIEFAHRTNPDAVVLDFQLPHTDGEQVARVLRHEAHRLPICWNRWIALCRELHARHLEGRPEDEYSPGLVNQPRASLEDGNGKRKNFFS